MALFNRKLSITPRQKLMMQIEVNRRCAAAAAAVMIFERKKKRARTTWKRQWLHDHDNHGVYMTLIQELHTDVDAYANYFRMTPDQFSEIERRIRPRIQRQDTNFHKAITTKERLAVTLRYLSTGETFQSMSYAFRLGATTIAEIVIDTCIAIYESLKDDYMKMPQSEDEWLTIAKGFQDKWNFPNTLGAIDGKHIALRAPPKSGSSFYNYKHFFSIVLMALVDSDYRFIYVDIGCNCRISDGGVFAGCSLQDGLNQRLLNRPQCSNLPGTDILMSYHIIGDDAFPLRDELLKPFPFRNMSVEQRIYNYRISRARRVVENAFGIMASRFRVFLSPILLSPRKAETLVMAACTIHNFLRICQDTAYIGHGSLDEENAETHIVVPGSWRGQDSNLESCGISHNNGCAGTPVGKRQQLMKYVSSEAGAVSWQNNMI